MSPSDSKLESSTLHAVVIGIDHYAPNTTDGGESYAGLRGAVRDAEAVAAFLRVRLGVPGEQVAVLVSRDGGEVRPGERPPTYEAMVSALRHLADAWCPGDLVHIHYSGHGGRAAPIYPR